MDRKGLSFGLCLPFKMLLHMCLGQSGETIQGHFPVFGGEPVCGLCVHLPFLVLYGVIRFSFILPSK